MCVTGFWWNPFTDSGFHTVVKVYRFCEDPWTKTKEVTITGTIWHNINVMSQKEIGFTDLTFNSYDQGFFDHQIDSIKQSYYHIGDSIIKLQNETSSITTDSFLHQSK